MYFLCSLIKIFNKKNKHVIVFIDFYKTDLTILQAHAIPKKPSKK